MKRPQKIVQTFDSQKAFYDYLKKRHLNGDFRGTNVIELKNLGFEFDLRLPIFLNDNTGQVLSRFLSEAEYRFKECLFSNKLSIVNSIREIFFEENSWFKGLIRITNREKNLTFKDCEIQELDVSETKFGTPNTDLGKLRLKSCEVYNTNFKNTTFHALVDFYYTVFHENVVFYKTDFLNIVVLSAAIFKKNLLFTYTLLNDKVIMRNPKFEAGFDFSLAILKGHLAIFDLEHSYSKYLTESGLTEEKEYEKAVTKGEVIPIQNKLETYRILKVEFEKQQNIPEYLNFKLYEKKTYKSILDRRTPSFKRFFDQSILWLNRISNNHGTSYSRAFFFILIVGLFFFYCSLIATKSFEFSLNPNEWEFSKGLGYYIQFLIPTHKFYYMGDGIKLSAGFYVFDFLGRVFVGYGIYQFIQAFRKFR